MIIKDLSIHVPTTLFSSAEKLRLEKESARPTTKQVFLLPKGSRKVTEAGLFVSYKTGLECSISSLQKKSPLGQLSPKILAKSQWLKNYQKVSFKIASEANSELRLHFEQFIKNN